MQLTRFEIIEIRTKITHTDRQKLGHLKLLVAKITPLTGSAIVLKCLPVTPIFNFITLTPALANMKATKLKHAES